MTELVIPLTLLGIAEHLVGFGGLLESLLRLRVVTIAVGMVLQGGLAIGAFDIVRTGLAIDTEHVVIIAFGGRHHRLHRSLNTHAARIGGLRDLSADPVALRAKGADPPVRPRARCGLQ